MLKKRIIPVQLLCNNRLVKSTRFEDFRDVGDPVKSSKIYSAQDADELIFLNVDRDNRSVEELLVWVDKIAEECFMPLAIGGGISKLSEADLLFARGADKVVVNSAAYFAPELLAAIATKHGSQALVVSIDFRIGTAGQIILFSDCGRRQEAVSFQDHLSDVVSQGAGEILINSIDRDGMMKGYDIEVLREVTAAVKIPVIVAGGAGSYMDLMAAFQQTPVSGVACGSLFNFADNSPLRAKAFLKNYGIPLKRIK